MQFCIYAHFVDKLVDMRRFTDTRMGRLDDTFFDVRSKMPGVRWLNVSVRQKQLGCLDSAQSLNVVETSIICRKNVRILAKYAGNFCRHCCLSLHLLWDYYKAPFTLEIYFKILFRSKNFEGRLLRLLTSSSLALLIYSNAPMLNWRLSHRNLSLSLYLLFISIRRSFSHPPCGDEGH